MNPVMWNNSATRANHKILLDRGVEFIEPDTGEMACGESGTGRFPEPKLIFENIISHISKNESLANQFKGISILITAGPTIENIDPIRFVSNRSSGKQGFAIATELAKRGAKVTLITGPVNIPIPKCEKIIQVTTAKEMLDKVIKQLPADILICSAAVADWKFIPQTSSNKQFDINNKIKKSENDNLFLKL